MDVRKSKDSELEETDPECIIGNVKPQYHDKYVALTNFIERDVVGYDKKISKAIKKARRNGYDNPVVVYCPSPGISQIF